VIDERQVFVREFFEIGRSAVAEEMNLAGGHGFFAALLERKRPRRLQRIGQTRRRIGGGARLQRAPKRSLVGGRRLLHLSRRAGEQHHHLFAVAQTIDPFQRLGAGFLEARRLLIGRLHRGRAVEDDDAEIRLARVAGEEGPHQREDDEREQEQLENEQPIVAELLERRAGLGVREKLLPEQRAPDELHHSLALEQVEDDDDRQCEGEEGSGWSQEAHGFTSRATVCRSRRSGNPRSWGRNSSAPGRRIWCASSPRSPATGRV